MSRQSTSITRQGLVTRNAEGSSLLSRRIASACSLTASEVPVRSSSGWRGEAHRMRSFAAR